MRVTGGYSGPPLNSSAFVTTLYNKSLPLKDERETHAPLSVINSVLDRYVRNPSITVLGGLGWKLRLIQQTPVNTVRRNVCSNLALSLHRSVRPMIPNLSTYRYAETLNGITNKAPSSFFGFDDAWGSTLPGQPQRSAGSGDVGSGHGWGIRVPQAADSFSAGHTLNPPIRGEHTPVHNQLAT